MVTTRVRFAPQSKPQRLILIDRRSFAGERLLAMVHLTNRVRQIHTVLRLAMTKLRQLGKNWAGLMNPSKARRISIRPGMLRRRESLRSPDGRTSGSPTAMNFLIWLPSYRGDFLVNCQK